MSTHHLKNNLLSLSVNSFGAELISLKNNSGHELIWQADKNIWPRYAPVLFPIVGKLKNDQYTYQNKTYTLSQHGFARDKEFILIHKSETKLQFELTANKETLVNYPFHFSLIISYEVLKNKLIISYKVFNPDAKELLFSIGAHPGFNCKRVNGESLSDLELEFPNTNELTAEKLNNGLLSNETYKVKLNDHKLELNKELFENDALVFKNSQIKEVILSSKKSDQKVGFNCENWPYFGIWTKKGCDDFICLEPWFGIADSQNADGKLEGKEGILRLKPYENVVMDYEIILQ